MVKPRMILNFDDISATSVNLTELWDNFGLVFDILSCNRTWSTNEFPCKKLRVRELYIHVWTSPVFRRIFRVSGSIFGSYSVYFTITATTNKDIMFNVWCGATCPTIIWVVVISSERHLWKNYPEWRLESWSSDEKWREEKHYSSPICPSDGALAFSLGISWEVLLLSFCFPKFSGCPYLTVSAVSCLPNT